MKRVLSVVLTATVLFLGACDDEPETDLGAVGDSAITDEVDEAEDFDTLDGNGDSYLDSDEIAEWADDVGTFTEWDVDADSELDPDEVRGNAFELWDADDNGKITDEEWKDSAELWYPNDSDLIVLNDVDLDGDSELDADEFSEGFDFSVLGETWTTETWDEETFKAAYFELYDADNDGEVSETEWANGAALFGTPAES